MVCDALKLAVGSIHNEPETVSIDDVVRRSGLNAGLIKSAIKVLGRLGVFEVTPLNQPRIGIHFKSGHQFINQHLDTVQNEAKRRFLDAIVRLYIPEALSALNYHDLGLVTSRLELPVNPILKGLEVFAKEGVLTYHYQVDDPIIRVAEPRNTRCPVNREETERLRNIQLEKLEHMIGYALTSGCRSAYIRNYFGEPDVPDHCGFCDRCLRASETAAANGFSDHQAKLVLELIQQDSLSEDALLRKSNLGTPVLRAVLKWLAAEGRIIYDRKRGVFKQK